MDMVSFIGGVILGSIMTMIGVLIDQKMKTGLFFSEVEEEGGEFPEGMHTKEVEEKGPGYTVNKGKKSITCNACERTSYNQMDVKNKYCGFCHKHHDSNS